MDVKYYRHGNTRAVCKTEDGREEEYKTKNQFGTLLTHQGCLLLVDCDYCVEITKQEYDDAK